MWCGSAGKAQQAEGDRLMAFGKAGIGEGADLGAVSKAGIGHQHIQAAKRSDGFRNQPRWRLGFREIGEGFGDLRAFFPRGGGHARQGFAIGPGVKHQRDAGGGEGAGRRRANATRCPGDENASCRHDPAPVLFGAG